MTAEAREHESAAAPTPTHAVESWRAFAEWAVEQLGLEWEETGEGYRLYQPAVENPEPAESDSRLWPSALLTRRRQRDTAPEATPIDFNADSPEAVVHFLLQQVATLNPKPQIAPADQPAAIHEITDRLFSAYQVDGGKIHMAGCRLEATPFVRWSSLGRESGEIVVRHWFTNEADEPVEPSFVETLGLGGPMVDATARPETARMVTAAAATSDDVPAQTATATVLSRRAVGALQATIDGHDLSIPFDDWARTLTAPPAICPESGRETFHLLATDDGRIAAAEATGVCEATGRRKLLDNLRTCRVTGKLLSEELCTTCPATGEAIAEDQLATCPKCQQLVGKHAIGVKDCRGCLETKPLPKDSPLRSQLLAAAPVLKNWGGWRLAETETVQIIEASTLFRRLLVVINRENENLTYAATKPRLFGEWKPLPITDLDA